MSTICYTGADTLGCQEGQRSVLCQLFFFAREMGFFEIPFIKVILNRLSMTMSVSSAKEV